MTKEMLINTVVGQESRIAIVQDNKLEELYIERTSSASHVGNIYKGRVVNIESAIQAVFIDFGLAKHGFLHISDVHPQYFPGDKRKASEDVGRKRPRHTRPPIQDCFKRGREVVVQMTKEGIGTKGPTMTTYLSIPGRMLVMMPGMNRLGISRKIESEEIRNETRTTLAKLKLEPNMGFIVRTAGVGKSQRELQRDMNYLTRLWKSVEKRIDSAATPSEIYQESDLVTRTIRDVYKSDIERILCDDESVARKIREFFRVATPRTKNCIELYTGAQGLFHDFGVEEEIEKIYMHKVNLPSGGSLVFDQTEALVAIDVNSGRFRDHDNAEMTALKTNTEAASEIARQLRLRDMGGVIVIDFIDMRESKNRRTVERTLRDAMKFDRAKTKLLRINAFGIFELTRQRMRPSLKDSITCECPHCDGAGRIKSQESLSLQVMRNLQRAAANDDIANIEVSVNPLVAHHLSNFQRKQISNLEAATGKTVTIQSDAELTGDEIAINCTNVRGSKVAWEHPSMTRQGSGGQQSISLEQLDTQRSAERNGGQKTKARQQPEQAQQQQKPDAGEPVEEDASKAKKSRRRGRRGGRKHKKHNGPTEDTPQAAKAEETPREEPKAEETMAPDAGTKDKPRKTRRKRSRRKPTDKQEPSQEKAKPEGERETNKAEPHEVMAPAARTKAPEQSESEIEPRKKKKTRRKRSRKKTAKRADSSK